MKKILTILLSLVFLATATVSALANGNVSYDGNAQKFVFASGSDYSLSDLFSNFKGVMPGDTLTQTITVKNDASDKVKVDLYLRSLGATEESKAFLSQLSLQVTMDSAEETPYLFDAALSEPAQLTDWVCLGTLYSGGTVDLIVTLQVPAELGNEYQNQIGYLNWEFKAEEFPVEDSDPKPPNTSDSKLGWWFIPLAISLVVIVVVIVVRKRKQDEE